MRVPRPAGLRSPLVRRLLRNERAAALVEFALIAPVFVFALIGLFDLSYNIYTSSLLEGAIQKAARDSTIEGANSSEAQIDAEVTEAVESIVASSTVEFQRMSYTNFADMNVAEDFTDSNDDGLCNEGEPFEDVNGNNLWDEDRGATGMGGARDAVLYIVTVTYDRQFPLHNFIDVPARVSTEARTVLRNQPFAMQDAQVSVEHC